ncbi:MAG: hypothetical protein FJZ63_06220 [Chlamydiae bacterium]|nr:hypothetical protein [Chlamydiota bacterium]
MGKKENKDKKIFEFDLEKDLHDAKFRKNTEKEVTEKILEIKQILRQGVSSNDTFEEYGVLLRGYAALQKIINRVGAQ